MKVFAPKSAYRAKLDGTWEDLLGEIRSLGSDDDIAAWEDDFVRQRHRRLPENWQEIILEELADRRTALRNAEMDNAFRQTIGGVL